MLKKINLLLIDNSAMGYMQEQFGTFLPKYNFSVSWVLMSPPKGKKENPKKFGFANIFYSPQSNKKGFFYTFINFFFYKPYMIYFILTKVKLNSFDAILVRNDLSFGFPMYIISKIKKIPFIFYLGFPKIEYRLYQARNRKIFYQVPLKSILFLALHLRSILIKKANIVFIMSDYWSEQIIEKFQIPKSKIFSLPAGSDPVKNDSYEESTKIRNYFNLKNYPTLFYMGSIDTERNPEFLIEIIKNIKKEIPNIRLLILYGRDQNNQLKFFKKIIDQNNITKNIVFAPPVSHKKVGDYIKASNVGLSPIPTIPVFNVSTPHKFIEMLGNGCPVVASDIPDQKKVIKESGGGFCVPYDAESFSNAILRLLENPENAKSMGQKGKAYVLQKRSYQILSKKIDSAIRQII